MVEIFRADHKSWNDTLASFDLLSNQLHFTSEYHELFRKKEIEEPLLFVYRQGGETYFYPFIRRKIDLNYADITSVFGYTGPISSSQEMDFLDSADSQLCDYLNSENIVSELIRFNPILENHRPFIDSNVTVIELKPYVIINLQKDIDQLFYEVSSRLRTYIRRAQRDFGHSIEITKEPDELVRFFDLYSKQMKIVGAHETYFFSSLYFERLIKQVRERGFLICVKSKETILAGLLFLNHGIVSFYHHGARQSEDHVSSIINKLLMWEAIKYLKNNGLKWCLLGGGVTHEEDDHLLRFKMHFGGFIKSIWLGKRIHNEEVHHTLCNAWELKYPQLVKKYTSYIDKYIFTS